jgi:hypothetical protein
MQPHLKCTVTLRGKIDLDTQQKPLNPYGKAKKKSFNLVKKI